MTSLQWHAFVLTLMMSRPALGCFDQFEPLELSSVWMQATDIYSYHKYEIRTSGNDEKDMMDVFHFENRMSWKMVLQCLRIYSPDTVLVKVAQSKKDSDATKQKLQCLRFHTLSKGVILLSRSEEKFVSKIDCDNVKYSVDQAILISHNNAPLKEPSPLHGTYEATLYNAGSETACNSIFRFQCNNNRVVITFWSTCKPPVFKYYKNKLRHQQSIYLEYAGSWSDGANMQTIVLKKTDKPLGFWCLHYVRMNGTQDMFNVLLSFDGIYSPDDFGKNFVLPTNAMQGSLARFIPNHHYTCSDKVFIEHCQNKSISCSTTNMCPGKCKRCYDIPKTDFCKFLPMTLGRWETVDSKRLMSVNIDKDGVETDTNGKYFCRPEKERTIFPVVQYEQEESCMPLYACVQMFSLAPGVLNFYLRPTVISELSMRPVTCEETNAMFMDNPDTNGEMITLINVDKLQEMPCDFGRSLSYYVADDDCQLSVSDCSGKCQMLDVSLDNETCKEQSQGLPIAKSHRCYGSFKFQDGIRGLITYSSELEKYSCWAFTSSRLFVAEPYKCNSEAVSRMFVDKFATEKYNPVSAFIVFPKDSPSRAAIGELHSIYMWLLCFVLFIRTLF